MSTGLPRRLYRSRTDKMLGGVSAGLAAYFDIDPVLVRLLWVAGAVFTGGLLALAYILLWIIVPQEDDTSADDVRGNVNEPAGEARSEPTPGTSPMSERTEATATAGTTGALAAGAPTDATVTAGTTEAAGDPTDAPATADTTEATPPPGETDVIVVTRAEPASAVVSAPPNRSGRELLTPAEAAEVRRRRTMTAGVILLAFGLLFLATNLGLFRWFNWGLYWPLILVVLGALLIWNRTRSGA